MANRSNTLGKNERLKSRKLISTLFREGKAVAAFPVKLLYVVAPDMQPLQDESEILPVAVAAGFTASSRTFKKATDRNRIKRLLRECYRTQKHPLVSLAEEMKIRLSIFFIFTGKELPEHDLIKKKTAAAIELLIKKLSNADK